MRTLAFVLFFIILILGIINYLTKDNIVLSKFLYSFTAFFLICFAGLREIGIDHDSVGYFNYYGLGDLMWLMAEPTFGIISEIGRFFFNDFRFVLIVYAIIGIVLKFKAINRLTDLHWLTIIVYFSTFFLLHDFTQIRVAVASGILLLALIPLSERRIGLFLLLMLCATLFHYSSIVAIVLLFLNNNHLTQTKKILIGLSIPIGLLFYIIKINPLLSIPIDTIKFKMQAYQDMQSVAEVSLNVFNLVYIVKYLTLYVLLIFYEVIYRKSEYISILLQIYALSLFSYLALSANTIFSMRISELLGIVEIMLIPMLYYIIKPRWIGAVLVVFIALISLIINIYSLELIYPFAKYD